MDSIPDELISRDMHEYQMKTGQKMICGTKKLLGVMRGHQDLAVLAHAEVISRVQTQTNSHS